MHLNSFSLYYYHGHTGSTIYNLYLLFVEVPLEIQDLRLHLEGRFPWEIMKAKLWGRCFQGTKTTKKMYLFNSDKSTISTYLKRVRLLLKKAQS